MIEQIIKEQIDLTVVEQIKEIMPILAEKIANHSTKPEYLNWGRYLTAKQACTYLGIRSKTTLRSWEKKYSIQRIQTSLKSVLYDREELDRVMAEKKIPILKISRI